MPESRTLKKISGFEHIRTEEYISEYRLKKNGLTVLYAHIDGSPTVTTNIVYNVGSQHELPGQTGLAHMFEHMLFKPTTGKDVTWKDLENKGAVMNATTWVDRTHYYFNLPTQYLDNMLAVEADRMRNLKIIDKEFQPERANVLSEYEMCNSTAGNALEWAMVGTAFSSHGYKHDTIGFRNDIEGYTSDLLKEFYDRFYWPNNATLVVVGDLDVALLLKKVKAAFGHIPGKFDPKHKRTIVEPKQEGERRVQLVRDTPVRTIKLAFKTPPFTSREWTALGMALHYLGNTPTSPLYKKLIEANHATSVRASIYPTKDPFLAIIDVAVTESASYETIERITKDEIAAFVQKPLAKGALAALQEELYTNDLFSRDGTLEIAQYLTECVACEDWTRYFSSLAEIKQITAKEIQEVAKKYLTWEQVTIGTLEKPVLKK